MRRTPLLLAAAALALPVAACGDDGDGSIGATLTAPPGSTQTVTAPSPVTEQIAALRACVGGKPVTRVDVFEPTYQFVRANGGGGFAVKLKGQQVEFLVTPTEEAATTASEDVSNQLIALQQTNPEGYAAVAATATQTFGNVIQIVPTGATPPDVNTKIATCASQSAGGGAA
ncbi:MAG TPA: hypothetical protein VIL49_15715 [Capillimicrobium sp.]|jgi:hypothetical protein